MVSRVPSSAVRLSAPRPRCGVGEGAVEEGDDLGLLEGAEGVDAAAGEQRGDDFEAGVFGGGADEADAAALDVGEEGVLLGLVEAVDLVDEEDGAGAVGGGLFGVDHDLLDLFDAGEDGGELDEGGRGEVGDDLGEGGFADAGRAPEDERGGVVVFDLQAEGFAGSEEVGLAEELVEGAGAHALGERGALERGVGGGVEVGGEEAHERRAQWDERDCSGCCSLAEGFVEQHGAGDGGVERFDRAGNVDAVVLRARALRRTGLRLRCRS